MNKIITLAAIAAIALSSCSKDTPSADATSASNAIEFRTNLSKATPTDNGNFTAFSLNASTTASAFDFMKDVKVSRDVVSAPATWSYAPAKFWPTNGATVYFFGFSPVNSRNITTAPAIPTASTSTIGYTVPLSYTAGSATDEDFVVAATKGTSGSVALDFKHALSMVTFQARNITDTKHNTQYTIEKIEMLNLANVGTLTQDASTVTGSFSWTVPIAGALQQKTYIVPVVDGGLAVNNGGTAGDAVGYKSVTPLGTGTMILPQTTPQLNDSQTTTYLAPGVSFAPGGSYITWIVVTYRSIDGGGGVMNPTGSKVCFPLNKQSFKAGINYRYSITFNAGNPISISGSVSPWPAIPTEFPAP